MSLNSLLYLNIFGAFSQVDFAFLYVKITRNTQRGTIVLAEDPGTLLSDLDLQYQEQLFEQTRPLLELSVAASMHSGETAFEFDPGDDMPESFAAALDHFSGLYGFNETSQMHEWLQSNYALSVPQNITEKSFPEVSYTGLFLLELTPSPDHSQFAVTAEIYMAPKPYEALTDADWDHFVWADMMATITLQHDDSASLGWKVTSLHYSTAYFSDDTDEPQMSDVPLLENYYSEKYGCSIARVPSIRCSAGEKPSVSTAAGVSGAFPQVISFSVISFSLRIPIRNTSVPFRAASAS